MLCPQYSDASLPSERNMTEKVRTVNSWIEEFNSGETGLQLDLARRGVEPVARAGQAVVHRYQVTSQLTISSGTSIDEFELCLQDWREPAVLRKLHLAQPVKEEIAAELSKLYTELERLPGKC